MTIINTKSNLSKVDQLGELKAQIADLTKLADRLADGIKEQGAGKYDGDLFTASVVKVEDRWSADSKAIAAKLKDMMGEAAYDRFTAAHQKKTAGYTSLTLIARS